MHDGKVTAVAGRAEQGPLDAIADHIERATNAATEIGHKLNEHADRVHGTIPNESNDENDFERDRPSAALERVFDALKELDRAQAYMAEAADRNTTLA